MLFRLNCLLFIYMAIKWWFCFCFGLGQENHVPVLMVNSVGVFIWSPLAIQMNLTQTVCNTTDTDIVLAIGQALLSVLCIF